MKRLGLLALAFLLAAVAGLSSDLLPLQSPQQAPSVAPQTATPETPAAAHNKHEMRVVEVVDGDSLFIEYQGRRRELRLMGIDAPEGRQEWGEAAADFTRDWTSGKTLRLTFGSRKVDKYDRMLAYVWDGDMLLNLDLVRAGLAYPYMLKKHEPYFNEINHAFKEAKYEGAGFWAQGGLELEPRLWRKKHR